jgi:hypothetical protein
MRCSSGRGEVGLKKNLSLFSPSPPPSSSSGWGKGREAGRGEQKRTRRSSSFCRLQRFHVLESTCYELYVDTDVSPCRSSITCKIYT